MSPAFTAAPAVFVIETSGPVTVIAAVGPVGATGIAPASPLALLKYTPVAVATLTLK